MCNCIGMVRTFNELQGLGRSIPPSQHHPKCEDYILVEYSEFKYEGGNGIVMEKHEMDDFIESEKNSGWIESEDYSITPIYLTADQYENMPEFDGF